MLPILNVRNKEKTLHTSEVLTGDTIKSHWSTYKGKLKARDVQRSFEKVPELGMGDREMLDRNYLGKARTTRRVN